MESKHGKEKKSLRWYKTKKKQKMKKYIMGLGNSHFYLRLGLTHLKSMKRERNGEGTKILVKNVK